MLKCFKKIHLKLTDCFSLSVIFKLQSSLVDRSMMEMSDNKFLFYGFRSNIVVSDKLV